MKQLNVDETKDARQAFGAAKDAQSQHRAYWATTPKAKQDISLKLRQLAMDAYKDNKTYLTARAKFVAVKVEHPKVSAAWQSPTELAAMNAFVLLHGIEVVASRNNLLFRVPR